MGSEVMAFVVGAELSAAPDIVMKRSLNVKKGWLGWSLVKLE